MAVLPENMDKLNPEDTRQSFSILENYIRYMGERIEFAMRNVTRSVAAAGVSSAEVYVLLTALNHELSALKSTVNTQTGSINGISADLSEVQKTLESLQKADTEMGGKISSVETNLSNLSATMQALQNSVSALDGKVTAAESSVAALNGTVSTVQAQLGLLEQRVAALEQPPTT